LVLMYATKFLDGLNGLVSGMSVIGGVILLITSITLGQSFSVLIALAMTGAFLGFLPYNFQGKIFLGEGGSTLAGFLLGVLALLGPAKISITLLILGIPILDVLWVVYERIFKNKKSPFKGDLSHLHFKLINFGLNEKQTVVLLWILSLLFGLSGLLIKDSLHGVLLLGLLIVMVFLAQYTRITR
jgi:UDP-GlcNAc:undecaprenyl-phosphate/decaprenyl-phosphate GlcNAc-1-phosphate transferase